LPNKPQQPNRISHAEDAVRAADAAVVQEAEAIASIGVYLDRVNGGAPTLAGGTLPVQTIPNSRKHKPPSFPGVLIDPSLVALSCSAQSDPPPGLLGLA